MLDAGNPNANTFDVDAMPRQRVSQRGYYQRLSSSTEIPFPPRLATVSSPAIRKSSPKTIINITTHHQAPIVASRRVQEKGGCNCNSLLLSQNSPRSQVITPLWGFTPDWTPAWSEAEIEKEEARRLVWASLILVASHTSHAVAHGINRRETLELWLTRAENVSPNHCPHPRLISRTTELTTNQTVRSPVSRRSSSFLGGSSIRPFTTVLRHCMGAVCEGPAAVAFVFKNATRRCNRPRSKQRTWVLRRPSLTPRSHRRLRATKGHRVTVNRRDGAVCNKSMAGDCRD